MPCAHHNRFLVPAWGVSLTLHGLAVAFAMLFAAQVRPIVQDEPFKWDVALVDTVKTESASEPVQAPAPVPQEKVVPTVEAPRVVARRPVEPPPDTVMHRVAPQQTAQMVHPESQPPKPVEQREEPPPPPLKTEPVTQPVKPVQEKPAEAVKQQVVETPKLKPEPVTPVREPEPVQSVEPVIAQQQPVAAPPSEPTISRTVETPATPSEPPATSAHSSPNPQEAPVQVAKASPTGPETKIDHRWLAESLWRRVAELKRYPSSARLHGQEGKVVLKAVIRSDGHLAEVTVQKSSGHQILDAAAIEAVKLACPLHMKHAIGKPEIVVSLPIVYSLAN